MEKIKPLLPLFILLACAVVVIAILFPLTHPYGGLNLPIRSNDIVERSRALLSEMNIDVSDLWPAVQLKVDRSLFRQTQQRFGIGGANTLLRDSVPVYQWSVRWKKTNDLQLSFGEDEASRKQKEKFEDYFRGDISFVFDTKGKVLGFSRKFSDTLHLPSLTSSEARFAAIQFLKSQTSETVLSDTGHLMLEKSTQQLHRTDYEFDWKKKTPVLGNSIQLKIIVAGNVIALYERQEEIPPAFQKNKRQGALGILYALFLGISIIGMILLAIQRIRSYEIGFRLALFVGIIVGLAFDVDMFLNIQQEQTGWGLLIVLLISPLFLGGALTFMWAVSESITREVWRDKLISLDLLSKGRVIHSKIGKSVIRGITLGAAVFALTLLLVWLVEMAVHLQVIPTDDQPSHVFDSAIPIIYVLSHGIFSVSFLFTFIVLFGVSLCRKYIQSKYLLIPIGSICLALFNLELISPMVFAFGIQLVVGAVVIWTFVRYDALTSMLVMFSQFAIQEIAGLMVAGNSFYTESGIAVLAVFLLLLLGSCAALFRKKEIVDFDAITPAFAKHITERQRMQQELEIARSVQMSFLPKNNPSMPQFDIASRCAPAMEVGGDYYDFIEMTGNKLAVAIGDVSGKGTQAAFYMTLTKGFLRALAHVSESPAKVLTLVNHLFYENVERGIFISMIYGVFDTMKNTLTLARAGHNPVLMRKSQSAVIEIVNPTGLALGLDAGTKFSQSIEEVAIPYQPGDLFIFYTDGFTEAMNSHQEQFGEERLSRIVEQRIAGSAKEIMEEVFAEIKSFAGKAEQHDDMTIVVVKVNNIAS